ncbi:MULTISPECIES: hypothetical protein [unclassified Thioalkalivibrio]|uniref:hypothetical protein n=1 Tax=unclassified Thioalkalivibrio TaxID=2621013 RepID=UPI00037CCA75|nr:MULTISPECIES: hypothetical protein [unclassified Thioalkalivibrio]
MVDEFQPDRTVRPVHTTVPGRRLSDDHDRDPVFRPAVRPTQQRPPRKEERGKRRGLIDDYA